MFVNHRPPAYRTATVAGRGLARFARTSALAMVEPSLIDFEPEPVPMRGIYVKQLSR